MITGTVLERAWVLTPAAWSLWSRRQQWLHWGQGRRSCSWCCWWWWSFCRYIAASAAVEGEHGGGAAAVGVEPATAAQTSHCWCGYRELSSWMAPDTMTLLSKSAERTKKGRQSSSSRKPGYLVYTDCIVYAVYIHFGVPKL